MLYSEKVMDHFQNPRNVGKMDDADGVGEVGNAVCGDIMKMYIKVKDGIITDVKFNTFGCGSAIATSSMATEMIKGKPIEEAAPSCPTRLLPRRWTVCRRSRCTAPCWRRKRFAPPSRTTTTVTALPTIRTSSAPATARAVTHTIPETGCKGGCGGLRPRRPGIKPPAALAVPAAVVPGRGRAPGVGGSAGVGSALRGACLSCRLPTLTLVCFFSPPSPRPPSPPGEGGALFSLFCRGLCPRHPGI